jgi:hypothetical protein
MTAINDLPQGLKIVSLAGEYASYAVDADGSFTVACNDMINTGMTASDVELWGREMLAAVEILKGGNG